MLSFKYKQCFSGKKDQVLVSSVLTMNRSRLFASCWICFKKNCFNILCFEARRNILKNILVISANWKCGVPSWWRMVESSQSTGQLCFHEFYQLLRNSVTGFLTAQNKQNLFHLGKNNSEVTLWAKSSWRLYLTRRELQILCRLLVICSRICSKHPGISRKLVFSQKPRVSSVFEKFWWKKRLRTGFSSNHQARNSSSERHLLNETWHLH